jgi:molecular chaperone GrpE (heat shock protein)
MESVRTRDARRFLMELRISAEVLQAGIEALVRRPEAGGLDKELTALRVFVADLLAAIDQLEEAAG